MNSDILYSEINMVCVLILLLLSLKVGKSMFLQKQKQQFLYVVLSNALFLMLDCVWIFIEHKEFGIPIWANWLLNACYYMLSGMLGYYWFQFSETIQESKLVHDKKYRTIVVLPVCLLVVLTIASYKTGWLFYIDDQNHYHRGPAYVIQLLTSYGYVIFTALKGFILSFQTEDYRRKSDLRTLATFVLPTLVMGGLQVVCAGYPLLCIGNTFGILYIYLTLQEQLVSLDALTKLNNRNQLFQYLSGKMAHIHEEKALYLLIMDIDYFKSINDQYGHVEGDHALKLVANSLMKVCSNRNYFISRYGGDEFVAICEIDHTDSIDTVCNHIHQTLAQIELPYKLTLSIGYTKYVPDIRNQQDFIERADKELYKIKKSRKS